MLKNSQKNHINLVVALEKAEEVVKNIPPIKKRRERKRIVKFIKVFSFTILVICLIFLVFTAAYLFQFKKAYSMAMEGKDNLELAVQEINSNNFNKAALLSSKAQNNFNLAYLHLEKLRNGLLASNLNYVEYQINNLEYLIKTAEILSKVTNQGSQFGQEISEVLSSDNEFSFSEFSKEEKGKILKLLYESGPELNGIKANIDLAYLNLKQVEANSLLLPIKSKLEKIKSDLYGASELVNKAIPFAEMIPVLAGYPDKSTFLVMFQNSDELRPTGGFLGTYGILEVESGDILRFDTHDIYHMDMPVQNILNIIPPEPIKEYLIDKWYMRDSNWSPDWPTAAQRIEWFYHKENALLPPKNQINNFEGEFDGVIGITPEFVKSLLALVGPVEIEGHIYNQNNFTDLLQYRVEQEFVELKIPHWERKEVIGDIAKELKIKLFNLPFNKWKEIIYLMNDNIYRKNILVYLQNEQLENLSKEFGWSGEVKNVEGDYLMIVDSNMGAYKTDAVMSKSISYNLEESANGLFAKLRINYAHNGQLNWKTTTYKSYTRIYVPSGSNLIKVEGFDSKLAVGKEFNKTYFGGYFKVKPGEMDSIYIEYKLPESIKKQVDSGQYELYIQKQPGNIVKEATIDLNMKNSIKSYSPDSFFVNQKNNKNIGWTMDLATDKIFKIGF